MKVSLNLHLFLTYFKAKQQYILFHVFCTVSTQDDLFLYMLTSNLKVTHASKSFHLSKADVHNGLVALCQTFTTHILTNAEPVDEAADLNLHHCDTPWNTVNMHVYHMFLVDYHANLMVSA